MKQTITSAVIALTFVTASTLGSAQDKLTKFILPVAAGSGVDTIMRASSKSLATALASTVVIENQAGAGGIVGTAAMVKSVPDGATLSVVSNNHVIYPSVYKSLPFDPINDITPIAVIGSTPMVLVVNPKLAANNSQELIAPGARLEGFFFESTRTRKGVKELQVVACQHEK